jgi:hypothetical protein
MLRPQIALSNQRTLISGGIRVAKIWKRWQENG